MSELLYILAKDSASLKNRTNIAFALGTCVATYAIKMCRANKRRIDALEHRIYELENKLQ